MNNHPQIPPITQILICENPRNLRIKKWNFIGVPISTNAEVAA